jgi:glycosyltransferase involved in cell wall biosynthesis
MRVLHVVEALGGGVITALESYICATPDVEHVVVGRMRAGFDTGALGAMAGAVVPVEGSLRKLFAKALALNHRFRPEIVHVHSSIAGGIVRATFPAWFGRIVYTPHCYAFESRSRVRLVYYALERVLARLGNSAVIAVSPRECALAIALGNAGNVYHVTNSVYPGISSRRTRNAFGPPRIVTVGRVCDQKDPRFFALFAEALRQLVPDVEIVWIGGGSAKARTSLIGTSGVVITGWISKEEVISELGRADAYVHTAAWEGMPLTLLEAASLDIPVFVRHIPAFDGLGLPFLARSPHELAEMVVAGLADRAEAAAATRNFLLRHTPAVQAVQLAHAYSEIERSGKK